MPVVDREPALSMSTTLSHPTPEGESVGVYEDLPTVSFGPIFSFEPQASIAGDDDKRPADESANVATDPTEPEEIIPADAGGDGADLPPPFVPSLSSETPDKEPDRRREVLDIGDAYIFEEPTLTMIRERFANERVVVVDGNGVLCNEPLSSEDLVVNPDARKTLEKLEAMGYALILWSSALESGLRGFLDEHGLMKFFSLSIFRDNYSHESRRYLSPMRENSPSKWLRFQQTVANTPWLSESERQKLNSQRLFWNSTTKTPQLLFRQAALIDDGDHLRGLLDESAASYPYIRVRSFRPGHKRSRTDPYFRPQLVSQVAERFPPPPMED